MEAAQLVLPIAALPVAPPVNKAIAPPQPFIATQMPPATAMPKSILAVNLLKRAAMKQMAPPTIPLTQIAAHPIAIFQPAFALGDAPRIPNATSILIAMGAFA